MIILSRWICNLWFEICNWSHYLNQQWLRLWCCITSRPLGHNELKTISCCKNPIYQLWDLTNSYDKTSSCKTNSSPKDLSVDAPSQWRWRHIVTSSLIGWAHTQNDPCSPKAYPDIGILGNGRYRQSFWFICLPSLLIQWRALKKDPQNEGMISSVMGRDKQSFNSLWSSDAIRWVGDIDQSQHWFM